MIRFWKEKYCDGGHTQCARFHRANEGRLVPLTLLPNGRELRASMLKAPLHKGGQQE